MSERKVVIGLPVYNGQKYLGAAIESHLSQSFGDFDLVISDNGSTDATPQICADFAAKDKRVKFLRSAENRGILWNHRRVLDAIQSRGIRLAIDDFGTGYSSMSLMKQFPIDTIKIDRSFVRDLPEDTEDCAIAEAIISMGKALGMTIVAEGVETADQQAFLREHACDEMQGYLFSKPITAEQMTALLRSPPGLASPPLQPEADGYPGTIANQLKDAGA